MADALAIDRDVADHGSVRSAPAGWPVLHQRWSNLIFLHWRFASDVVRPLVPAGLQLDLFDGDAWVGVTPFVVTRMRPVLLPPLPGLSTMNEINVRIYVERDGIPGIWFPSLDATNPFAVWAARLAYDLPYYQARMRVTANGDTVSFRSRRTHEGAPPAAFDAVWRYDDAEVFAAAPGTLDFFLIERYVLYSGGDDRLWRARIHHRPWPLRKVNVVGLASTMLEAQGLLPRGAPLVHAQAEPFDMAAWLPTRA